MSSIFSRGKRGGLGGWISKCTIVHMFIVTLQLYMYTLVLGALIVTVSKQLIQLFAWSATQCEWFSVDQHRSCHYLVWMVSSAEALLQQKWQYLNVLL